MKRPEGLDIVKNLSDKSDLIFENFKTGVLFFATYAIVLEFDKSTDILTPLLIFNVFFLKFVIFSFVLIFFNCSSDK